MFWTVWSIDRYYRFSVYRWIDGHRSEKAFMIYCRYYRSKIKKFFNQWIDNIDENETKSINWSYRSISSVSIHWSIADCAHLCHHAILPHTYSVRSGDASYRSPCYRKAHLWYYSAQLGALSSTPSPLVLILSRVEKLTTGPLVLLLPNLNHGGRGTSLQVRHSAGVLNIE